MKKVYLIRHGKPEFPGTVKLCIGRSDLPISMQGWFQAALLGIYFHKMPLTGVYSSSLRRGIETASTISGNVQIEPDFDEIHMGEWEGLSFSEIKTRYPDIYAMRGKEPFKYIPPGAESPAAALERFENALYSLLKSATGDITIVTHAGLIRLLICKLQNTVPEQMFDIPQPYGCYNTLLYGNGRLIVSEKAMLPKPFLNREICMELLDAACIPQPVIAHSLAVADYALKIADELGGERLDAELILCASLLHDIARTQKDHAITGAGWLRESGYPEIARIVETHHDVPVSPGTVTEAEIVFYADKRMQGEKPVSIDERFSKSAEKLNSHNAHLAHRKQYEQAMAIQDKLAGTSIDGR